MIKGYDEDAMRKRKTPEDRADYYVSYVTPSCYEITINCLGSEILELKKKIMETEKCIKERQLIISKIQTKISNP